MDRMPFFKLALTLSWSTLVGKLKVRWNWPTERSETQNLCWGFSAAEGLETCFAEEGAVTVVPFVWPSLFSSSTVAWRDLGLEG